MRKCPTGKEHLDPAPKAQITPSLLGDLLDLCCVTSGRRHCAHISGVAGAAGRRTAGPTRTGCRTRAVALPRDARRVRASARWLSRGPSRRRPGSPGPACEPRRGRGRGHRRLWCPGRPRDAAEGYIDQWGALPGAAPAAHGRHRHSGPGAGGRGSGGRTSAPGLSAGVRPVPREGAHHGIPLVPPRRRAWTEIQSRSSPPKRASTARCSARPASSSSRSLQRSRPAVFG